MSSYLVFVSFSFLSLVWAWPTSMEHDMEEMSQYSKPHNSNINVEHTTIIDSLSLW